MYIYVYIYEDTYIYIYEGYVGSSIGEASAQQALSAVMYFKELQAKAGCFTALFLGFRVQTSGPYSLVYSEDSSRSSQRPFSEHRCWGASVSIDTLP